VQVTDANSRVATKTFSITTKKKHG
jgi:hypothetical protein